MTIHYDLNISETAKAADVLRYVKCGYTRLAFNRVINVNEFVCEGDTKKQSKDAKNTLRLRFEKRLAQPDLSVLIDDQVQEATKRLSSELKIFSRLTLVAADIGELSAFMRDFLVPIRQFDLLAVEPRSNDVLMHAANSMAVELITFDLSSPVTGVNRHVLARCLERGIAIELNLAAALATTYARVNTVRFISELQLFRCPAAIVTATSGAQNALLVRNQIGVAAVLATMGLADKLVSAVGANAERALQRGLARKHTVHGSAAIIALGRRAGVVSVAAVAAANNAPHTPQTTPATSHKRHSDSTSTKSPQKKKLKCQ